MKGGFRIKELDGCEMTVGFRQVPPAREHNTIRPVFCVLYELDDDKDECVLWVSSRRLYRPGAMGYKSRRISTRVVTWNQVG